jgi:hypothetical protein
MPIKGRGNKKGSDDVLRVVHLPRVMIEYVKEHGDPETIIPFMVRNHLNIMKQSLEEESRKQEKKNYKPTGLPILFFLV